MARDYSEVIKNSSAEFAAIANGTFAREYAAALKKTKNQFAALTGGNYSFTPAIPALAQGRKYEIYFAYKIERDKKIPRPTLKAVADYKTGDIAEFTNADYNDFADAKKYPRGKKFDANVPVAKTAREQMALLKNLEAQYEKVREIAFKENLSDEEKNILADYVKILAQTVPNELLSFCVETETKFFEWLKSATA